VGSIQESFPDLELTRSDDGGFPGRWRGFSEEKKMTKKNAGLWALLALSALAGLCWNQAFVKGADRSRTLKVKLNYTGAGAVNEKHKIHVLVFDTNPYTMETFKPRDSQATLAKNGAVTFSNLNFSPAYVLAFFDKTGTNEPESGSPIGLYGADPTEPEPISIEAGKTVEIALAFDDSISVP
jgi:hypothetical protein